MTRFSFLPILISNINLVLIVDAIKITDTLIFLYFKMKGF